MAGETTTQSLNPLALRDELRAAGWDAVANESLGEVAARLETPPTPGVWSLSVDRAGRYRFGATQELSPDFSLGLQNQGRAYSYLLQRQQTLIITGELASLADLAPTLRDLASLVQQSQPKPTTT